MKGHSLEATSDTHLPNFGKPPVTEVALAVRFEPIELLSPITVARLYERRFEPLGFPKFEEKPPVHMPVEQFGRNARIPEFHIEFSESMPSARHWFVNTDGTELVQIQRDWFARNWRKIAGISYPRYPSVREPFESDLLYLDTFLHEQGFGGVKPIQCELTYINELNPVPGVWEDHGDFTGLMRSWISDKDAGWHPEVEEVQLAISHIIKREGQPVGRLRVKFVPGFTRTEGSPVYLLTLTARGAPLDGSLKGAMGFLDLGHDWIVRTFAGLTSDGLHENWEKS